MLALGEQSNEKNCFFFNIVRKGGGLVESKISLTEKAEIFPGNGREREFPLTPDQTRPVRSGPVFVMSQKAFMLIYIFIKMLYNG